MNHCQVSADECRHAHQEGQQEAMQACVEEETNSIVDQLQEDLDSARMANGQRIMTVTRHTHSLLLMMFEESDVYSMAEQIARIDLESRNEI